MDEVCAGIRGEEEGVADLAGGLRVGCLDLYRALAQGEDGSELEVSRVLCEEARRG